MRFRDGMAAMPHHVRGGSTKGRRARKPMKGLFGFFGDSSCDTGYTGSNCDECDTGYSLNSDGECVSSLQECQAGYTGADCSVCVDGYTLDSSGNNCVPVGSSTAAPSSSSSGATVWSDIGQALSFLHPTATVAKPATTSSSLLLPLLFVGGAGALLFFMAKKK